MSTIAPTRHSKSHYALTSFRQSRAFSTAFILPGCGLAVAMFPQAAAEQSHHVLGLARAGALSAYSVIGWALIIYWLFCTVAYSWQ